MVFLHLGVTGKQAVTKKHVLVMDEVDGMAGNEDRGMYMIQWMYFSTLRNESAFGALIGRLE